MLLTVEGIYSSMGGVRHHPGSGGRNVRCRLPRPSAGQNGSTETHIGWLSIHPDFRSHLL